MKIKTAICDKVTYLDEKIKEMKNEGIPLRKISAYEEAISKLEDTLLGRKYEFSLKEFEVQNEEYLRKKNVFDRCLEDEEKGLTRYWSKDADLNVYFYSGSSFGM